jgi:hypothetical protein
MRSRPATTAPGNSAVATLTTVLIDDSVAVEARRDRALLRGARGRAVLAPEVDLVARALIAVAGGAVGTARRPRARRAGVEIGEGSSGAPAILLCASAWMIRRDRGRECRNSRSALPRSAGELRATGNPRHQSSAGGAAAGTPGAAR